MGACASKFTILKNASDAPPPETREVKPAEEVLVKKDDAASLEDEASRRQSLGHLLSENDEKKGLAVADKAPAPVADDLKSKGLDEEIPVAVGEDTAKLETKEEEEMAATEKPEAPVVEETVAQEKVEEKPAEETECEVEKSTSDAEKVRDEKSTEIETPEIEKAGQKQAEEKPVESTKVELEDKHILEPKEDAEKPKVEDKASS